MSAEQAQLLLKQLKAAQRLPSPVGVAIRVLELCRRDDSEIMEIAEVIMSDPALSARLLAYANSAAFGAGRDITTVRDAVLVMGLRAVKLIALGFSLAVPEADPRCRGFDFRRFWVEGFATAVIARHLAARHFGVDREEAFTAGLLSGIGQLALAHSLPRNYPRILRTARSRALRDAEDEALGLDHAEFGAALLADWGLPDALVAAVGYRFSPDDAPEVARDLARSTHVARRLAPLFVSAGESRIRIVEVASARDVVENTLGLDEESWSTTLTRILAEYRRIADLFESVVESQVTVLNLYAEAQAVATRVGIEAQLERNRTVEVNRELLKRATTDLLTGIANRAKLLERLGELIMGLPRGHGHFVVLLFDVDHFKAINDTHGHEAGDRVLIAASRTAMESLRDVDLVARYGGDEFAVLAPQTDCRGGCVIAARLRRAVEHLELKAGDRKLAVTASFGFVLSSDYRTIPTAEQLIHDADAQLFLAKRAGRNSWAYAGKTTGPTGGRDVAAA